jgi:ABC-type sugar transport system substrate-binding protein
MRNSTLLRRAAALSIVALVTLTGCSVDTGIDDGGSSGKAKSNGMGDDGVFTVAAFTAGYGTPSGKLSLDNFVKKAKAKGWKVTLYTSAFDYDKLNSDVTSAVGRNTDAILAGFPDPRQMKPIVQAAKNADIPIFSIDGGVKPNPDFAVDVTFGQKAMADGTVNALKDSMGGLKGKNVMVIGHDPQIGIHTRSNMAVKELKKAGAHIVGGHMKLVLDPGTSRTESLDFVTDYLRAHPGGLDGVWTGWDDAALGAVQAIEESGQHNIHVTGVDALAQTIGKIKDGGPMYATASQDWISVVDQEIGYLDDYAKHGTLPDKKFVERKPLIVTPDNVDDFKPTLGVSK